MSIKFLMSLLFPILKKKVNEINSPNSHIEIRGGSDVTMTKRALKEIAKCIESEGAYKRINAELISKISYILKRHGNRLRY